jgi:hypothetical protein
MKSRTLFSFLIPFAVMLILFCSKSSNSVNGPGSVNPPEDHTVNKDGVRHKNGLQNATQNCVSCHGQDLTGGSAGISCYSCHGKKWN